MIALENRNREIVMEMEERAQWKSKRKSGKTFRMLYDSVRHPAIEKSNQKQENLYNRRPIEYDAIIQRV